MSRRWSAGPWAPSVLVLVSLAVGGAATAATWIAVTVEPADPAEDARFVRLSSPDGAFFMTVAVPPNEAVVTASSPDGVLSVGLTAPGAGALAPRHYEGAPSDGVLALQGTSLPTPLCGPSGTFDVHEVAFDGGALRTLAADFSSGPCEISAARLRGAVRYRTGDDACSGRPDGTPCLALDPCTAGDRCVAGVCTLGPPADCDDGDPLTADACDPFAGCIHPPVTSTWDVRVVARAIAATGSRTASARTRGTARLEVRANGTWEVPAPPLCGAPGASFTSVGTWTIGRRGRLILRQRRLRPFERSLAACIEGLSRIRVVRQRQWLAFGPPGRRVCRWDRSVRARVHVCGRARTRLRAVARGVAIGITVVERLVGTRADDGAYTPPFATR